MTMMHFDNYDGAYGYDLKSIILYHPFLLGSRAIIAAILSMTLMMTMTMTMMLIYCMMMMKMWISTIIMHVVALLDPN